MNLNDDSDELSWFSVGFQQAQKNRVTSGPGLYVIKKVNRVLGLPVSSVVLYVGRSKNLKRRFLQHLSPVSEHNQQLLTLSWEEELEFWFAEAPSDKLTRLESLLIRQLEPIANISGTKGE